MLPKHESNTTSGATMAATAECGNCGLEEEQIFLHHVRHRGSFLRFCTSCVLRHYPHSFCPTCFTVYHPSPPTSPQKDAVTCSKCHSSSHSHCVGPNSPSPYICPLCINPNSPISFLKRAKDFNLPDNVDGRTLINKNCGVIDKKAARIFFAASRISCMLMNRAALSARAEAEMRAIDAVSARKRAREALEHVALLVGKEKMKNKSSLSSSEEVLRSTSDIGGLLQERRNSSSRRNNSTVVNSNSGMGFAGAMVVGENHVGNVDRMNSSNEVLSVVPWPSLDNGVTVEMEENPGGRLPANRNGSGSIERNHGGRSVNGRSSGLSGPKNRSDQWVKNGVAPLLLGKDQDRVQGFANGRAGEENTYGPER